MSSSTTRSRPSSTSSSFLQDVPGSYPESATRVASNPQSLSQAVHARRAEYTRPKQIKIKVGSWNTASFKGTEKDVGGWFVGGKGVSQALSGLRVSSLAEPHRAPIPDEGHTLDGREGVESQEARYKRKQPTIPEDDPGSLPGGDEIGLYVLGLQEIVDINSASEALRPYTDPTVGQKWKSAIEESLPQDYQLVAEQQLIGLLLLVYASKEVYNDVKSVSTTSVGTGLMGYMGNKGATTARIVLGETTRLVFINCHLAAGTEKGAVERRNWDFAQIVSRTKFQPIQDCQDFAKNTGEMIGDEDFAFVMGDLNYRLEGIPGDDVRRLLMLHTRNEYDLSHPASWKVESELNKAKKRIERRERSGTESSTSSALTASSSGGTEDDGREEANFNTLVEDEIEPSSDPASLQTTLSSLLPHDELQQQQRARKAFHDGWREGPITFLPTYKYDVGTVGIFDSSEKRRAPSWCDRILYRTRRDRLQYESKVLGEEEARRKDEEMKSKGLDQAGKDEEVLYDYDPDEDGDADEGGDYDEITHAPPGVVITKEGFEDEIRLDYYTAHQRVLSSDHKPLDAVFTLKYDAIIPELKSKVHQEVARELDRQENEDRPNVTVVVDRHYPTDEESSDEDPAKFEGVQFGDVRYAQSKHRSLTIANTGRVPATIRFIDRPTGPGQSPGIAPMWLSMTMNGQSLSRSKGSESSITELQPGETCNIELEFRVLDLSLARALNEGADNLDDILVLRVENGRDHFIPVRGTWLESSLGHSISKLIRIPEGGIRKLQHQRPDSSRRRDMPTDEQPVKWSAPRELFRLTEATENLTVRSIAEWEMMSHSDSETPPWNRSAGWPFAEDSWTVTEPGMRHDNIAAISEALDTDTPFDQHSPPELTQLQRLESVADYLILFLRSLHDGVVTEELWHQIDTGLSKLRKPTKEEERISIQEVLSQSPSHSISFILLTSMLDRVVDEVTTATQQSGQTSQSQSPARGISFVRRKTYDKHSPAVRRQLRIRALAALLSQVMIRATEPSKERERSALQDRKTNIVEVFLTRDEQ